MGDLWIVLFLLGSLCSGSPTVPGWCKDLDPSTAALWAQCSIDDTPTTETPANPDDSTTAESSPESATDDWREYLTENDRENSPDGGGEATKKFFEGDIIRNIDPATLNISGGTMMANAVRNPDLKWPNGVVPFTISKDIPPRDQKIIRMAMDSYHKKTCIRWVPRKNEPDYVSFQSNQGCNSYIGRIRGEQPISLQIGQCYKQGKVEHEMMHAIGFVHEQSRTDRDQYVVINWDNIPRDMTDNFQKYGSDVIDALGAEYDYGSVMHYGPFYFASDPNIFTILPRQKGVEIGQRRTLSPIDIWKINKLYDCQATKSSRDKTGARVVPSPRIKECPNGWVHFASSCYYFSNENARDVMSWSDANDVCGALLGRLAMIVDDSVNDFLLRKFGNILDSIWIGARHLEESLRWIAPSSNTDIFYTNWADGEPKSCVQMNKDGKWQSEFCEKLQHFICERPLLPRAPSSPSESDAKENPKGNNNQRSPTTPRSPYKFNKPSRPAPRPYSTTTRSPFRF